MHDMHDASRDAASFAEKATNWSLSVPSRESHIRPLITRRIKELQPSVSNRQIARTLGVAHTTIERDTDTNVPADGQEPNNSNHPLVARGTNVPPALTGREAAIAVNRRERVS